jgi:hypothetical protein
MKKFRIRFFGLGTTGECEMPFNHEPTVNDVEDMAAMYLEQGLLKLHFDRFYRGSRWWITYEEVTEKKEKELVLGTWV